MPAPIMQPLLTLSCLQHYVMGDPFATPSSVAAMGDTSRLRVDHSDSLSDTRRELTGSTNTTVMLYVNGKLGEDSVVFNEPEYPLVFNFVHAPTADRQSARILNLTGYCFSQGNLNAGTLNWLECPDCGDKHLAGDQPWYELSC